MTVSFPGFGQAPRTNQHSTGCHCERSEAISKSHYENQRSLRAQRSNLTIPLRNQITVIMSEAISNSRTNPTVLSNGGSHNTAFSKLVKRSNPIIPCHFPCHIPYPVPPHKKIPGRKSAIPRGTGYRLKKPVVLKNAF